MQKEQIDDDKTTKTNHKQLVEILYKYLVH